MRPETVSFSDIGSQHVMWRLIEIVFMIQLCSRIECVWHWACSWIASVTLLLHVCFLSWLLHSLICLLPNVYFLENNILFCDLLACSLEGVSLRSMFRNSFAIIFKRLYNWSLDIDIFFKQYCLIYITQIKVCIFINNKIKFVLRPSRWSDHTPITVSINFTALELRL